MRRRRLCCGTMAAHRQGWPAGGRGEARHWLALGRAGLLAVQGEGTALGRARTCRDTGRRLLCREEGDTAGGRRCRGRTTSWSGGGGAPRADAS
jgi:hypothetical protein